VIGEISRFVAAPLDRRELAGNWCLWIPRLLSFHCKENMKFIDSEITGLAKDAITVSYISVTRSKPA